MEVFATRIFYKKQSRFQSKAKISGDKLIVTVDEYDHKTNYSPEDYAIMYLVYSASHQFCTTKLFLTK
jgi:hypothetical protein